MTYSHQHIATIRNGDTAPNSCRSKSVVSIHDGDVKTYYYKAEKGDKLLEIAKWFCETHRDSGKHGHGFVLFGSDNSFYLLDDTDYWHKDIDRDGKLIFIMPEGGLYHY